MCSRRSCSIQAATVRDSGLFTSIPGDLEGVPGDLEGVPGDLEGVPGDLEGVPGDLEGGSDNLEGVSGDPATPFIKPASYVTLRPDHCEILFAPT